MHDYQRENNPHIDYLFLRFADVAETLADQARLRMDFSNYWLDARELLWMPPARPPIKVGRLTYRHGGEHLHLPGEYWRTDDPIRFLNDLVVYLLDYLQPSATTIARVDWTTILDPFKHTVRDVAMSCFAQWPSDTCGTATMSHQQNEYGETYYVGKRGRDPTKMRKRECLVRIYDRLDRVPRQLRVEFECKGIDTDGLPTAAHQLTWSHAHALNHIGHLIGTHASGPPTLVATGSAACRVDATQTFRRAAGMLLGYLERNRLPAPGTFPAQLAALGRTYGIADRYLQPLLKRCQNLPPASETQRSFLDENPLNLTGTRR